MAARREQPKAVAGPSQPNAFEAARQEAAARKMAALQIAGGDRWDADRPRRPSGPRSGGSTDVQPDIEQPATRPQSSSARKSSAMRTPRHGVYEPPHIRKEREEREHKLAAEAAAAEADRNRRMDEAIQAGRDRSRADAEALERKECERRAVAAEERRARNASADAATSAVATRIISANIELTRAAKADARALERERADRAKKREDAERRRRQEAEAVWDEDP